MYKIGLSSCGFDLTEENFSKLEESGIGAIEISMPYPKYDLIDYRKISELQRRYHVELWSYHLPFFPFEELDISSTDKALRTKTVAVCAELIKKAADIGIERFVIHPSGEPISLQQRKERMACVMQSLDVLAEIADRQGAILAVEDLPRTCLGNSAEEMLCLLQANEKLRVCLDTNHLLSDTNLNFIERVGKKIVTVHISDYDFVDEKHWMPGEGLVDFQALYSALRDVGYEGVWLYEIALKSPSTLHRSRDLTFDDFVRNARAIFAGRTPQRIL